MSDGKKLTGLDGNSDKAKVGLAADAPVLNGNTGKVELPKAAAASEPLAPKRDEAKILELVSKDGKRFTVVYDDALISNMVKTAVEEHKDAKEVPIPSVTGAILALVVDYMKEHKGVQPPIIEKPLRSKVMSDVCTHKWDATFIDKIGESKQQLYDLILAANYMDIKCLLHLGCAKVAAMVKGQPLEKIKETLEPSKAGAAVAAPASASSAAAASANK